jgi:hypothetical protein
MTTPDWDEQDTWTYAGAPEPEDVEVASRSDRPARRRTTEPCPLCRMPNALSVTEVYRGYLCEDCAQES